MKFAHARIVACALLFACESSRPGDAPISVHDSAGVRIVEVPALERRTLPAWTVTRAPQTMIGGDDALAGHDLFGVRGAGVLSDGRIVVADGTSAQLRFFAPSGTLVATVGRKGSGPGEFQGLLWLQITTADSILAYDYNLRRVSLFSPEGRLARSYGIAPPTDAGFPEPKGALGNGSIVFVPGFDRRFGTGERRDTVPFFLYDRDGTLRGEIGAFPGREEFFGRSGEAGVRSEVPFGRDVMAAVGEDRVVVGTTDAYGLSVFDAGGRLHLLVRAEVAPRAVDARELQDWKRRKLERMPEQMRQRLAAFHDELPRRDTHPAFEALVVDRTGMLWVKRGPAEGGSRAVWEVFGPSGEPVARAELPADIDVLEIGDAHVLARSHNIDGNEVIVRYGLEKQ